MPARLPRSASGRKRMKYSVNRQWVMTLEHVRDTFARDDIDPVLRVFRGDQRASVTTNRRRAAIS